MGEQPEGDKPSSRSEGVRRSFTLFQLRLDPYFLLLLGLCIFALAPLTAPGYFIYGHDARHSVYFLQMFDLSMHDGAWYPRWAADMVFGYGYPLWLILAPIPFFIGEAFHLAGLDFVSAVKMVDGLAFFFSAITMYLFASRIFDKNAGLVAAIAYAYAPYHLVDLYIRAAQAELVAFVFPPLVLWSFHELIITRRVQYVAIGGLSYAGLVLAHISMALLFTPVIGLYIVFLLATERSEAIPDKKLQNAVDSGSASIRGRWPVDLRQAATSTIAIALALGISAVFLLPVLFEQRYLTSDPLIGGFFNYRKHFLNANQLLSPFWGYGYAGENGSDQFSLQLGVIPTLLAFGALVGLPRTRGVIRRHTVFFAAVTGTLVFLMLPISAILWEPFASLIAFAQFPWRLLIIAAFALAFLSGAAVRILSSDPHDLPVTLAVGLILVTTSYAYTEPQHTEAVFNYQTQMEFEVRDRELLGDTVWMTGERPQDSPLVAQYLSGEKLVRAIPLDQGAKVETMRSGGQSTDLRVDSSAPARIMVYTRYFPGWTATVDEQSTRVEPYGEQGLMLVTVPAGSHIVRLRFEDTLVRQIGTVISGTSLLLALGILWLRR